MAARVQKIRHDENTRLKIQAGNIIHRLQQFIMGEVQLEPAQVTAALGLLKKVLPDTSSVELSGEVATPYVLRSDPISKTVPEWQEQHPSQLQ